MTDQVQICEGSDSSESTASLIAKLSEQLADLQMGMYDKNTTLSTSQDLMLITIGNMLKTLHQLAPHEQISRLEAAVLRMQRMLASVVPATET